jgi:hypothetical protein
MSVEKEIFVVVGVAGFSLAVSFLFTLFQHAPLLVERRFRYHPALEGIVTSDGCQANYLSYASSVCFHQVCLFLPLFIIVFFALHLLSCFPSHRNHD